MEKKEMRNNSGIIFKNENATGNQPIYRGKVKVNDKEMEISLWYKESQNGTKYFSASFQEPYVKPNTTEPNVKINNVDDLPF